MTTGLAGWEQESARQLSRNLRVWGGGLLVLGAIFHVHNANQKERVRKVSQASTCKHVHS